MDRADPAAWLAWLEGLHPSEIDLGLERTARVARRLGVDRPGVPVFTVAGTNGKGSVCAVLESVLGAGGWHVGRYTSPHLAHFNERIRVGGREIDDDALCEAFAAVEAARGETTLTYFEFATLAAMVHFRARRADAWVLEVGLGGRLDATNVVDADVATVTSIALDHAEWLGSDVDAIAREKGGIARPGRPLICGMRSPPAGLVATAGEIGAVLHCRGDGFDATAAASDGSWRWSGFGQRLPGLPAPALAGGYQRDNATTALAALAAIDRLPTAAAIGAGLRAATVRGRFECHDVDGVELVLDVAHNPAAAAALAATLAARPCGGRTWAVLGIYRDKDLAGVAAALGDVIDHWIAVGLPGPRGRDADETAQGLEAGGHRAYAMASGPLQGYRAALDAAHPGDRVVVLGSFATVAEVSGLFL